MALSWCAGKRQCLGIWTAVNGGERQFKKITLLLASWVTDEFLLAVLAHPQDVCTTPELGGSDPHARIPLPLPAVLWRRLLSPRPKDRISLQRGQMISL